MNTFNAGTSRSGNDDNTMNEINPSEEDIRMSGEPETEYYIGDSTRRYIAEIGKIPLLSAEEELELGRIIREGGKDAEKARNDLVRANLRLVVYCAKRFIGRGTEFDDLNAMGIEGLIKAAEKFDYTLGYRFSTYATWWINQAISRGISTESDPIRVPANVREMIFKVEKARKALFQESGEEPSPDRIAAFLEVPEETVKAALQAKYSTFSIDTKVGEDSETTVGELLPDENAEDPCEAALDNGLKDAIKEVLSWLTPKEAQILSLRYGIGGNRPMTLEEVAQLPEFNVTRERIRQIEGKAIRKIRRSPRLMNLLKDYAA